MKGVLDGGREGRSEGDVFPGHPSHACTSTGPAVPPRRSLVQGEDGGVAGLSSLWGCEALISEYSEEL